MVPLWLYYALAVLLMLLNAVSAVVNLVALPGNWLIVGFSAVFALFIETTRPVGISWQAIGVLVSLAVLGEVIELVSGMAGAARQGASRRSVILSVVGSIVGSVLGAGLGIPLPVIGIAIGAILGGAVGALVGAAVGEDWKGRELDRSWAVGVAAFWGRLWGTIGKTMIGGIMVVIAAVDSFF
jgi:uncharacterized protein YqgC (DUF456 family)